MLTQVPFSVQDVSCCFLTRNSSGCYISHSPLFLEKKRNTRTTTTTTTTTTTMAGIMTETTTPITMSVTFELSNREETHQYNTHTSRQPYRKKNTKCHSAVCLLIEAPATNIKHTLYTLKQGCCWQKASEGATA